MLGKRTFFSSLLLKRGWEGFYDIYLHHKMAIHCNQSSKQYKIVFDYFPVSPKLRTNGTKMIETNCFNVLKLKIRFFI